KDASRTRNRFSKGRSGFCELPPSFTEMRALVINPVGAYFFFENLHQCRPAARFLQGHVSEVDYISRDRVSRTFQYLLSTNEREDSFRVAGLAFDDFSHFT